MFVIHKRHCHPSRASAKEQGRETSETNKRTRLSLFTNEFITVDCVLKYCTFKRKLHDMASRLREIIVLKTSKVNRSPLA
jgi:hypothetical protein